MPTDTKKFKNAVAVAIRKSRKKWNPNRTTFVQGSDNCGFCDETEKLQSKWGSCTKCIRLFWKPIGTKKTAGTGRCIPLSCDVDSNSNKWKRACTIMNKRFDKIAKIYGVDA